MRALLTIRSLAVAAMLAGSFAVAQTPQPSVPVPVAPTQGAGTPVPVPIVTDTGPAPSLEFKPSPQDDLAAAEPVKVPVQVPPPIAGGPKVVEAPPAASESVAPATRVVPGLPDGTPVKRGKPYVLGPLDVVEVKVWNDPKLSGIFDIGTDGTISFPLVGSIVANGLTAAELTAVIREKLTAVIIEPEVNVQVLRNNSKKYTILGGCGRTGEFPLVGEVTVLDALANCGGFKEFANLKKIYVLRGSKQLKFNYRDVIRGKNMDQNVTLENGDRIVVPDN
jgi:polysaccharide export outer membrane protein